MAGVALMVAGLPLLTVALTPARGDLALSSIVLLFLLAVVVLALVGGVVVGVGSALVAAWLINYYFIHPLHTLDIAQRDEQIALAVFVAVGAAVSVLVEVAGRRSLEASRASAQAEALSDLARVPLDDEETLAALLERARRTLGMDSVALKQREPGADDWTIVERPACS